MKNKKFRAFAGSMLVLLVMAGAALFILSTSGRYKVRGGQLKAAEIDTKKLFTQDTTRDEFDTMLAKIAEYFGENGLNTGVLNINDSTQSAVPLTGFSCIYSEIPAYEGKDVISRMQNVMNKKKIQLYLGLDCRNISDEQVHSAVAELAKNYKAAGIVLVNFSGDTNLLRQLKNACLNSRLVLQTGDTQMISRRISAGVTGSIICEEITADEYMTLKNERGKIKLLLHHSSPSMNSDIFVLNNFYNLDGAVLTSYDGSSRRPVLLDLIFKKNENLPLFNLSVSEGFSLTYPENDISTYYSGIFLTGTGAKTMQVYVNGQSYPARRDGTFGVYMELEEGDNVFTVSSGDKSRTVTVTKKEYTYSSEYETPWDDSIELSAGRVVQTVDELTSMLSDPDNDSSIIAGMEKGTKLLVSDSVETIRSGKKTFAYQLSNGAYVLSSKVEILNEASRDYSPSKEEKKQLETDDLALYSPAALSGASLQTLENGDEIITFYTGGRPAVVSSFTRDSLSLLILDGSGDGLQLPQSGFFKAGQISRQEDSALITFSLGGEKRLWGYDVNVREDSIVLYLKKAPVLAGSDTPLSGVTVMLDAGHGGTDSGALGVAAVNGPLEKTLNLSVAQATKALLEEYGATVIMTREEDEYLTLDQRRNMARDTKPDIFISVHHNSMDYSYNSTNASGSECYYFTSRSKALAECMTASISRATGRKDRGASNGYYYVTRNDIAPSVLMEYSFIINPQEYSRTYQDEDIYRAAFGTLQRVIQFLSEENGIR